MDGTIELDKNGRFYLRDANGRMEMPLVAEGLRKLGMLARLIATGALLDKGYLFWDETEANLNPRLIRQVARTIVEVAATGIQVVLLTHSLFLLREIEILMCNRRRPLDTRFFGLHAGDNGVEVLQGQSINGHRRNGQRTGPERPLPCRGQLRMQRIDIDGLQFAFPDDWTLGRYDDLCFYKNQIRSMWQGINTVDLIAVDTERRRSLWFIEVKDYRRKRRTKPSDLPDEVARKVYDSSAAMLPAKAHAVSEEQAVAKKACGARDLRVVLHLEQPRKHSRLFPRAIDPAIVQQKLRSLIKPIDPHPRFVDSRDHNIRWQVVQ